MKSDGKVHKVLEGTPSSPVYSTFVTMYDVSNPVDSSLWVG